MIKVTKEDKERYKKSLNNYNTFRVGIIEATNLFGVAFSFTMLLACLYIQSFYWICIFSILSIFFAWNLDNILNKRIFTLMKLAEDGELMGVN